MDSLVGYGSDDDDYDRLGHQQNTVSSGTPATRSKEEDNYEDVNMDLSEDSQAESEPELPPAEPAPPKQDKPVRRRSEESREREQPRDRDRDREADRDRETDRRDRRRESPRPKDKEKRRDDRHRSEKDKDTLHRRGEGSSRRGLLGDRPEDRSEKMPALMDVKPFGAQAPPARGRSHDARDAVSPRFVERDRREKDRERERDRDRHSRDSRRSEERRSGRDHRREERGREGRSRSRGAAYPPPTYSGSNDKRGSPSSGDYRPTTSYKVNKKLEVMEKMGLQIKTPDGSMATVQQLRLAAPQLAATQAARALEQVQKRKLLWSNKASSKQEEAGKWTGARFAQDSDGKQANKFMRLMGIKDPAAVSTEPAADVDPVRKQEELFSAMQAQYEVARATTHTMRGVGLGFQRSQY